MAEVPVRIVSVITTAAVDSDFWATHDGILYVVHGTIEPFTVQFRPGFETHFEDNGITLRRKKKEILKLENGDELKQAFSYAVTQRMAPVVANGVICLPSVAPYTSKGAAVVKVPLPHSMEQSASSNVPAAAGIGAFHSTPGGTCTPLM